MKGKLGSNIDKNFKRSSDLDKEQVYQHPNTHFRFIFKNTIIKKVEDIDYWNPSFKKKYAITDSNKWNENQEKVVKTNHIGTNMLGIDDHFKTGSHNSDFIQFNNLTVLSSFLRQGVI